MGTLYEIALAEAKAKEKQGLEREREELEIEKKKLAEKERNLEERERRAGNGKTQPSDDEKPDEPIKDGEGDQPQGGSALVNRAFMEAARHHLRGDKSALASLPTANESPIVAAARKLALETCKREGK